MLIVFGTPKASAMPLATSASSSDTPNDSATDGDEVLADLVSRRRDSRNVAGGDERAEPAAERAEHVAAQADGGGDEDEEAGKLLEGPGDGAEDESGDETSGGGEQVRDEARSDSGWIRANERAEPPHEAGETRHW